MQINDRFKSIYFALSIRQLRESAIKAVRNEIINC